MRLRSLSLAIASLSLAGLSWAHLGDHHPPEPPPPASDSGKAEPKAATKKEEKADDKDWKVDAPHGPYDTLSFTTDEGTWLALDVHPDGKRLVLGLLGDLYTLPIAGGEATRITSGPSYDAAPRFSPDGKLIA